APAPRPPGAYRWAGEGWAALQGETSPPNAKAPKPAKSAVGWVLAGRRTQPTTPWPTEDKGFARSWGFVYPGSSPRSKRYWTPIATSLIVQDVAIEILNSREIERMR